MPDPGRRTLETSTTDPSESALSSAKAFADTTRSIGQRRYSALIEASGSLAWRAKPNGELLEAWQWDGASLQSLDSYLASGWMLAIHPDDRDRVRQAWKTSLRRGKLAPIEYRFRTIEGDYRWTVVRGMAVRGTDGEIIEWVGTLTDTHETRNNADLLRESAEIVRLAVEATGLGIWHLDLATRATAWSPELKAIAGLPPDSVINDDLFYGLVHEDDRANVELAIARAAGLPDFDPFQTVYRFFRRDTGEMRWFLEWGRLIPDAAGNPWRIVGAIEDITDRRRMELDQRANEERWRLALRGGRMVAWELNLDSGLLTESDNAAEILGVSSTNAEDYFARVDPEDRLRIQDAALLAPDGPAIVEYRYRHPDGQYLWLEARSMHIKDGIGHRIVGITSDITEQKAAAERLLYAAKHDVLTGLPNRSALQSEIDRLLAAAHERSSRLALLLFDVDNFKDVNDTLGHDAGDRLLQIMAERLRLALGRDHIVARLGGDEFAALFTDVTDGESVEQSARNIIDALAEPFDYDDASMSIRVSVGISLAPDHASSPTELLKSADLALYEAKSAGRFRTKLYEPRMREAIKKRLQLLADLRLALDAGQIVPFYQPKVNLTDRRIVGFEALARWVGQPGDALGPEAFGAAFNDADMASRIDDTISRTVIEDVARWRKLGIEPGPIAVNFSSYALKSAGMPERLFERLQSFGLDAGQIEIEVPETVFLDGQAEEIGAILRRLHDAGVTIALDDFGTGYASLTHLKRFPVDVIKIDQSFIYDLEDDPDDAAIVSAVIGLGLSLGLKVVAEGVDKIGQVETLARWGCHVGQGYLFARPMAAAAVPDFIRAHADPQKAA